MKNLTLPLDTESPASSSPDESSPDVLCKRAADAEEIQRFLLDFLMDRDDDGDGIAWTEWNQPTQDAIVLLREIAAAHFSLEDDGEAMRLVGLKYDTHFDEFEARAHAIGDAFLSLVDCCLSSPHALQWDQPREVPVRLDARPRSAIG
jgi:hypothetical protein